MSVSELMLSSLEIDDDFFYEEKQHVYLNKKYLISSYLTAEEYNLVINEINKSKMSISKYVRNVLLGNEVVVYDELKEFVHHLSKIGNNINQLSKLANMGKINVVDISDVKELLDDVWKKINRMV